MTQPARTRRKDARPSEIIAAALALFAERGFAATKLEDVAKAAGISKGTIYLYFSTKEDLFEAVVRQELLPNLEAIEAMAAGFEGPTTELFHLIGARIAAVLDSDLTSIPKLVVSESGNFPEIGQFYADTVVKRARQLFVGLFQRGVDRGEFRAEDPAHLLPIFVGPVLLMLLWRHTIGKYTDITFNHHKVLETHIEMFLRALAS